jgi:hypothetical protein
VGPIGPQGPIGPTGVTGTTGQTGTYVWGTAPLTVTAFVYADVPGLNTTITVPASPGGSFVYIETDGGIIPALTCTVTSCSVIVDVQLIVDGAPLTHGGLQRISCFNNAANWQGPTGFWGMGQVVTLAPGPHTIKVQARLAGSFQAPGGALVSAGDNTIIQGGLSALVLNR